MTKSILASSLVVAGLALATTSALAQDYYCWKNDDGVWRCGDTVPPEQARFDRDVRNEQGIVVRVEQGEITEEERAEIAAQLAAEQERKRLEQERLQYDQYLLDSFLSVEDIERQRDRRLEQIEGEIVVTELYLRNFTRKLEELFNAASRYAPHSDREDAPPLPENLSIDIENTESSISKFEQRLTEIRANQQNTRDRYASDIERFREIRPSQP